MGATISQTDTFYPESNKQNHNKKEDMNNLQDLDNYLSKTAKKYRQNKAKSRVGKSYGFSASTKKEILF
jgi:hypothetical protein